MASWSRDIRCSFRCNLLGTYAGPLRPRSSNAVFQGAKWELPRVFLGVEAFLLQDQGWDAAFEERQPAFMCSRDDAKNAHDVAA